MPGLIPLLLNPAVKGNRASVVFAPANNQTQQTTPAHTHMRRSSTSAIPAGISSAKPSRPMKRLSQHTPAVLSVLPYTPADWKRTIAEIKRQHVTKRYRACFTRCTEILNNVKDTSSIEPAYLIYIHFYAASAMETCARPLFTTSPYRAQLLQQARTHYESAATLIQKAEESVSSRSRPSSVTSTTSSLHSPAGSVSSRAWTADTGVSSPTHSICSVDDLADKPKHSRSSSTTSPVRKKVSFSLPKDSFPSEPFIRPDSPTLGFDDEYFTDALSRPELPSPPKPQQQEEITPRAVPTNPFEDVHRHLDQLNASFMVASSVHRYCEHLESLKAQLAAHRSNLDVLIEPAGASSEAAERRAAAALPCPVSEEMRSLDRQARIERLRANGWQRKRFDARRYEDLRNQALAELA